MLKNVDTKTFTLIDAKYTKDKKHVYFNHAIIKDADPDTIKIMGINAYDDKNIYIDGKKFAQRDLKRFKVYNDYYFRNQNKIYNEKGKELVGVDVDTFETVEDKVARDKNVVYINGKILEDSDPQTIKIIKRLYVSDETFNDFTSTQKTDIKIMGYVLKDKKHVYNTDMSIVKKADAKTFEYVVKTPFDTFFKDKNDVYSFQMISFFGELPKMYLDYNLNQEQFKF